MAQNWIRSFGRSGSANSSSGSEQTVGQVLRRRGYKLGRIIGTGSYGKVHLAYRTNSTGDQIKIACKIVNRKKASRDFVVKFLPREINVIRQISHPHVVKFYDIIDLNDCVYIFMEYCSRGDLLQHIHNNGVVSEPCAIQYFRQLVSAMQYLHSLEITHRDLKCENILLTSTNVAKITDFGFSRRLRDDQDSLTLSDTFCGSKAYAAPEVLHNRPYNPRMADVWSLGCILHVMVTASLPFGETNYKKLIIRQQNRQIQLKGQNKLPLSKDVKSLIRRILDPNPASRATLSQVSKDPWLLSKEEDGSSSSHAPSIASSSKGP